MGTLQNIFPFGLWKRLMPVDYEKLTKGGLNTESIEQIPPIKIDFTGNFNENRLVKAALDYMGSRRYFFSEFTTFQKGAEHNHVLSGFKRLSEEYRVFAAIRIRVHGWEPSGLKDKPDKGFIRIWFNAGDQKWEVRKDYQGRFKQNPKSWGVYNFFSRYFLRRDFDDRIVPEFISDMYGAVAVVKRELGIETIAYDQGMKKSRTWH